MKTLLHNNIPLQNIQTNSNNPLQNSQTDSNNPLKISHTHINNTLQTVIHIKIAPYKIVIPPEKYQFQQHMNSPVK